MDGTVNYVVEAIRILGGITEAVVATGVSESKWHRMRRAGRIDDAQLCFFVAEKTELPADKLAGYKPGLARAVHRRRRVRSTTRTRRTRKPRTHTRSLARRAA